MTEFVNPISISQDKHAKDEGKHEKIKRAAESEHLQRQNLDGQGFHGKVETKLVYQGTIVD